MAGARGPASRPRESRGTNDPSRHSLGGVALKALLIDDESMVREGLSLKLQLEDPSIEARSCGTLEEARREIHSS